MGTYMQHEVQVRKDGQWETIHDFVDLPQDYGLYGWLADVRNYSAIKPINGCRGFPDDFRYPTDGKDDINDGWNDMNNYDQYQYHWSRSWLSGEEIAAVNFDQMVEDRRVSIDGDGGCTCEPGEGEMMTLRKFLGEQTVEKLLKIAALDDSRIVYCFS
jgi:hypothetical protein